MLNIAPYIAKYVRSLHARCDKLQIPYSQSQFGVVLMVDVVGFSTLTTLAAEKGDSGAEAVALEIGTYMGKCIEIIEYFGGDVVKFLGDAVLVSFQVQSLENEMDSHEGESARDRENRQKNILVQRAYDCGLQLLARLSRYRVYLTAEERTKHRSSVDTDQRQDNNHHFFLFDESTSEHSSMDGSLQLSTALDIDYTYDATTFNLWNCIPILFGKSRKNKVYTTRRKNSVRSCEMIKEKPSAVDLELHIALSCGNITNVILGEMYPANKAENDPRLARIAKKNVHFSFINGDENTSDHTLGYNGRLEYAICGPAVESLEDALDAAKAGEMSITSEAFDLFQDLDLSYEKREEFYIVKGIGTQKNKNNRSYQPHFKGFPSIHTNRLAIDSSRFNQTLHIEPPTKDALNPLTNPNYYKYINQSALYRLQHSPDNNFPAQFRDVTIMFISLGKLNVATPEGLRSAQRAMRKTIRVLVKYEGILQQFAVDDKGATLLAVFGLPPLSHEREAIFAAKAAVELRDTFRNFLRDFSISLSTGVIFNSVLPQGNPYRRDPAIAGDTIILAVRMLKFPFAKKNIVCDFATKQQIGRLCEFEDHGENSVKGKVKPLQIFGLVRFASVKNKRPCGGEKNSDFIGYKSEMAEATGFVNDWMETPNKHLLIISGPSGVGKSFFCHTLSKEIHSQDTICCWSSSTEVEKSSKYYLVKNILLALFEIIDSDQVPPNSRRRLSCYPGSPGSHAHDSLQFCALGLDGSGSSLSSSPPSPTTITTVKDLHVPSSNQNNTQLSTSFLSGSRFSSPGDDLSGENMPESSHELVDLITRCLKKCGEEEEFLPLFKVVFTALAGLHDNRATRRLDIRGRDILLTGVITRMVRYVSEHTGLVFISDDVQWADSASIRLLQHIHEHCQKVLLILATRPVKDYNVTFTKKFREVGVSREIKLNGLGAAEIAEIILQTFQTTSVSSVSPEIVSVIQKRTGGNPLYVKNMAIVLKDFNHVTVVEHVLVPSSTRFDLEDLLGNFDYKRIIKMQFDRVDNSFQELLTVASCLDQYFTMKEVQSVIKENNAEFKHASEEDARNKVEKYDAYHFIQKVDEQVHETDEDVYAFTHITIPQSIYDMVSYETRILLHRLLARYYESQLTRENYSKLLPKVTRHYLQTDYLDKQLYYLEALADLNMRSFLLPEATSNLERIVKILNDNPDLAVQFGRIHRSDIYRRLGMCFTMRTKLVEGEQCLFEALECLGHPWPQSEPEFLFKFWVNKISQFRHRKLRVFRKFDKDLKKKEIGKRIVEIMVQLSNIYFYTGKGRAFMYTCLVGLNACERLDEVGPSYTLFLARNSLLSWLNDEKEQSIFYITQALKYMDDKNDADTLTICAHLCFAAGKFKNATTLLYRSMDAVQTLGVVTDCQAFYRSAGLVITMRIFEGTLNNSSDDLLLLKQMGDTARNNGDFEAEIWLGVYHIGNALIGDKLKESEPFVALLEAHLKHAADYNKIAIHGTLLCYYARCHNYENARKHTKCLMSILPLLTVTPNIFPIFGLIFATMGLYFLIEDERVDFVSASESKNYGHFIEGISRLNHAFQQVKFWEFTQPCLYLARALPYISTGRTVEGFTVLQHGVMEMRFIQEIRFLKAFYWANLGKYSFTPADRLEWTRRAEKDFENLKIPSHIYCNPDPINLYSRGPSADLRGHYEHVYNTSN